MPSKHLNDCGSSQEPYYGTCRVCRSKHSYSNGKPCRWKCVSEKTECCGDCCQAIPWIILLANRNVILCANPPAVIPATYRVNSTSNTFFLPWRSDILPAIGVITAATIRYELNIHAAVPYDMLKSFIISGIAGRSIVSEKNTTNNVLLSIPRVIHALRLIVIEVNTDIYSQ
jgi:hypothetical protein